MDPYSGWKSISIYACKIRDQGSVFLDSKILIISFREILRFYSHKMHAHVHLSEYRLLTKTTYHANTLSMLAVD